MRLAFAIGWLALFFSTAGAEEITGKRIDALPGETRAGWHAYFQESQENARQDSLAVQQEVDQQGLTTAIKAPEGGNFKLPEDQDSDWYGSAEAGELADVILSYQTPTGGWSKHTAYNEGPRQPGMQFTSQNEPGSSAHYVATFDNRATTEELRLLALVWRATKRDDCLAGIRRGIDFLLTAQYPNGGWPQVYPLEGDYHDSITFNDDAMVHVLEVLKKIIDGDNGFECVADQRQDECRQALEMGVRCILDTQVAIDGRPTGWCAQHDALTLQPVGARALEPPTLSGLESSHILKFLMKLEDPSPQLVESIEGCLAWLDAVKIEGLTKTKVDGKTAYVADPTSTKIYWARFYSLETGQPVFPGRDGVLYNSFEAMAAKNKLGYDYYTSLPGSIVKNGQKNWRKMLAKRGE